MQNLHLTRFISQAATQLYRKMTRKTIKCLYTTDEVVLGALYSLFHCFLVVSLEERWWQPPLCWGQEIGAQRCPMARVPRWSMAEFRLEPRCVCSKPELCPRPHVMKVSLLMKGSWTQVVRKGTLGHRRASASEGKKRVICTEPSTSAVLIVAKTWRQSKERSNKGDWPSRGGSQDTKPVPG